MNQIKTTTATIDITSGTIDNFNTEVQDRAALDALFDALRDLSKFEYTIDGETAQFIGGIARVTVEPAAEYPTEVQVTITGKSTDELTSDEKKDIRAQYEAEKAKSDEQRAETKRIQPYVTKAVQSLDDADSVQMVNYFAAWDGNGIDYTEGIKVRYEGTLYKVLQDHKSQTTWTPTAAPSLFAEVLVNPDGTPEVWKQPDSTNPYMAGDRVLYPDENGQVWVSTVDNNVWAPGVYGWKVEA